MGEYTKPVAFVWMWMFEVAQILESVQHDLCSITCNRLVYWRWVTSHHIQLKTTKAKLQRCWQKCLYFMSIWSVPNAYKHGNVCCICCIGKHHIKWGSRVPLSRLEILAITPSIDLVRSETIATCICNGILSEILPSCKVALFSTCLTTYCISV